MISERHEMLAFDHRRALAAHLQDGANLLAFINKNGNTPFRSFAATLFIHDILTPFAQQLNSFLHIPVGLGESGLAIHHRLIGAVAQSLDRGGGNAHGLVTPLVWWKRTPEAQRAQREEHRGRKESDDGRSRLLASQCPSASLPTF